MTQQDKLELYLDAYNDFKETFAAAKRIGREISRSDGGKTPQYERKHLNGKMYSEATQTAWLNFIDRVQTIWGINPGDRIRIEFSDRYGNPIHTSVIYDGWQRPQNWKGLDDNNGPHIRYHYQSNPEHPQQHFPTAAYITNIEKRTPTCQDRN